MCVAGVATNIQLGGAAMVTPPAPPGVALNPQLGAGVSPMAQPVTMDPGFGAQPGESTRCSRHPIPTAPPPTDLGFGAVNRFT